MHKSQFQIGLASFKGDNFQNLLLIHYCLGCALCYLKGTELCEERF